MKKLIWPPMLFFLFVGGCTATPSANQATPSATGLSPAPERTVQIVWQGQGPKNCQYLADYELDTEDPNFKAWISNVTKDAGGNYFVVDKMWLEGQIFSCSEGPRKTPKKAKRPSSRSSKN